jgi:hypothetical protein
MESTNHPEWNDLAHAMGQLGCDILDGPDVTTENGLSEPKVLAIMLLSRTLSNLQGVITLLNSGLVVEARILVRCCFENAFWIAGLLAQGDEFVTQMRQDDERSRRAHGELLLSEKLPEDSEIRLRKELRLIKQRWPQGKLQSLQAKDVAWRGILREGYHIYSQLSLDAVHPSITALLRHYDHAGQHEENGKTVLGINVVPAPSEGEVTTTWDWACSAVLRACAGVNDILGGTPAGQQLGELADRHQALTRSGKSGSP